MMKKARANTSNDYWDKKLLDIEEKDPNRWRHTGFRQMYLEGDSSPEGRAAEPEPPLHYRESREAPRTRERERLPPRRRSRSPPRELPPARRARSPPPSRAPARRPPSPPPKVRKETI